MEIGSSNDTTVPVDMYYMSDAVHYITIIGTILLVILSISGDIYLIVVTRKFENLKFRTSQWFKNFAMFHLCVLVLIEFLHLVILLLTSGLNSGGYAVLLNLDDFFLDMALAVLTLIAVDWYASHYKSDFHQRHLKYFQRGIWICFLLVLPKYITSIFLYFYEFRVVLASIRILLYVFWVVVLLAVFILRRYKDPPNLNASNTSYAFTIPCIVLAMAFPLVSSKSGYSFCMQLRCRYYGLIDFMEYIGYNMFMLSTVVVLVMLFKREKKYKMAYLRCCKKKHVRSYDDDDLDNAESENEVEANPVNFDKQFETITF